MGKLEEYAEISEEFRRAKEGVEELARIAANSYREGHVYRLVSSPEYEFSLWEKYGGYKPLESFWGRFVGTLNPYLAWLIDTAKILGPPPFTRTVPAMLKIKLSKRDIHPVKYSEAAVKNFPLKYSGYYKMEKAWDVYVSQRDLLLAEAFSYVDIPIKSIVTIYIGPNASEEDREATEKFAGKYGIPASYGFPKPDVSTTRKIMNLLKYLNKRSEECFKPGTPMDPPVAALAEAYDWTFHNAPPLGSSDAVFTFVNRSIEVKKLIEEAPLWMQPEMSPEARMEIEASGSPRCLLPNSNRSNPDKTVERYVRNFLKSLGEI